MQSVAQFGVDRRAEALDRGDAGLQRNPGVLRREQNRFLRRFHDVVAGRAAFTVEVPADVHMRVDEPGERDGVAQVVDASPAPTVRQDAADPSRDNDDVAGTHASAGTVQRACHADDHSVGIGRRSAGRRLAGTRQKQRDNVQDQSAGRARGHARSPAGVEMASTG